VKCAALSVFSSAHATPDGTAIHDYIHVSDLVEAQGRAAEYLRRGGRSKFLNLCSGRGHSVLEVIECARQVTGSRLRS
jgi:UDP-glucose 4-epimerase